MALKAVIFDMDGLIFDTERISRAAWFAAVADQGFVMPEAFYQTFIGVGRPECEAMAVAFFGEGLDISRVRTFRAEWFEQSRRSGQLVFRPGFETLLSWMQSRDLKLGIGTSSSRAEALANFAGHEALSRFDVLVTRDDVRKSKPAPDIYLLAMARLGMTPRETLILEDSPTGMRAALASGARAVMVPDQICPDAGLEAAAFAVVPRLDALVDIIKPLV